MGMGYSACRAVAIKYEDIKELCPNEIGAIEAHEEFEGWSDLALHMVHGFEDAEAFAPLVDNLINAFKNATALDICLTYYDYDSGSRYDEVEHKEGCIFEVLDVYELTPEAKRLKEKLHFGSWVVFG
jgi:hypothetical protein